ncbi:LysR family transcriptional regulator [Thalassotalea fonticola]|uniref:LysR family transcriptional regulator n=1 Tax=Thalassotalea fonticola TaxID=3065649 RepID=A0ABZ0GQQ2_9GAMM|nr:LysR family transcriptional regulator [Colwelliaceae bacterium S1-1]
MSSVADLSFFALVVEANSFNKAAKVAGLSTPALSKKISKLESELGVQLLHRTTRRLSLTEAGETLYQHAATINKQVTEAIGSVSHYSEQLSGNIKISVPTISGELFLAECIAEFCQQYPEINIDVRLENEFVDLVKEGLDLAVRTGILEDSSLIAKPLIESHWVVCCAPKYIKQHGQPDTVADLVNHNCLAYTYQAKGANDWRFSHNGKAESVKVSGTFATNNSQALRKAALAGYGIAYVPRCSVYEDIEKGDLSVLLSGYQARSLGVYAVYPYTRYLPTKIRLLIEHIKQGYEQRQHYF